MKTKTSPIRNSMNRSPLRRGLPSDLGTGHPSLHRYSELCHSTVVWPPQAISLARPSIFAILILGSIVLTVFSWSAFAGAGAGGVNLPGYDYDHFNAPSALACRDTCGGESRCQAWTWVRAGFQGPTGVCWLKHSLPKIVKDACCESGPRNYISKSDLRAEDKINRPGSDFKNFDTAGWETCQIACAQNESCNSWTYVRPGVQGPSGRCWLKNRVARPVADPNTVSGVKFRPAAVRID
jgi:PAN domain